MIKIRTKQQTTISLDLNQESAHRRTANETSLKNKNLVLSNELIKVKLPLILFYYSYFTIYMRVQRSFAIGEDMVTSTKARPH